MVRPNLSHRLPSDPTHDMRLLTLQAALNVYKNDSPPTNCESPAALCKGDKASEKYVFENDEIPEEKLLSYKARKARNQRRYYQKYVSFSTTSPLFSGDCCQT